MRYDNAHHSFKKVSKLLPSPGRCGLTIVDDLVLELAVVICDDVSLATLDSDDLAMLACMRNTTHSIRGCCIMLHDIARAPRHYPVVSCSKHCF